MRVSIWYRDEERRPARSGHYLCHRGFGMGGMSDSDHELGYLYYNAKKKWWQRYSMDSMADSGITVYYWTDVDTDQWIEADGPRYAVRERLKKPNPSLASAWEAVEEAIERYRVLEALTNETV